MQQEPTTQPSVPSDLAAKAVVYAAAKQRVAEAVALRDNATAKLKQLKEGRADLEANVAAAEVAYREERRAQLLANQDVSAGRTSPQGKLDYARARLAANDEDTQLMVSTLAEAERAVASSQVTAKQALVACADLMATQAFTDLACRLAALAPTLAIIDKLRAVHGFGRQFAVEDRSARQHGLTVCHTAQDGSGQPRSYTIMAGDSVPTGGVDARDAQVWLEQELAAFKDSP